RAVIERDDAYARGQAGLERGDLLLDSSRDLERVLTVPHQHDPAGNLLPLLLQHAPTERRAELDGRDVPHPYRCTVPAARDDRIADVVDRLDPADGSDQILGVPLVDHPAADGRVRAGDSRVDLAQADPVGSQLVRIQVDLILPRGSANR